ncbi:hypothetical protein T310_10293, partial [Rasamsonia emersonii CBS 393.64]
TGNAFSATLLRWHRVLVTPPILDNSTPFSSLRCTESFILPQFLPPAALRQGLVPPAASQTVQVSFAGVQAIADGRIRLLGQAEHNHCSGDDSQLAGTPSGFWQGLRGLWHPLGGGVGAFSDCSGRFSSAASLQANAAAERRSQTRGPAMRPERRPRRKPACRVLTL